MSPTASLPPDVTGDEAEILWTAAGRPFVRTSDEAFADLPWISSLAVTVRAAFGCIEVATG